MRRKLWLVVATGGRAPEPGVFRGWSTDLWVFKGASDTNAQMMGSLWAAEGKWGFVASLTFIQCFPIWAI